MQVGSASTSLHVILCVYKTVTVVANLHSLIYNLLIAIVFPYTFCYQLLLISVEDTLNTEGLVALAKYQQVG